MSNMRERKEMNLINGLKFLSFSAVFITIFIMIFVTFIRVFEKFNLSSESATVTFAVLFFFIMGCFIK